MKHHLYKVFCNDDYKTVRYSYNSARQKEKNYYFEVISEYVVLRCILLVFTTELLSERFDLIC